MRIFSRAVFYDVTVLRLPCHARHPALLLGLARLTIRKLVVARLRVLLLNSRRAADAAALVSTFFVTRRARLLRERAENQQRSEYISTDVFQGRSFPAGAECRAA
jgi:hypothetical protein